MTEHTARIDICALVWGRGRGNRWNSHWQTECPSLTWGRKEITFSHRSRSWPVPWDSEVWKEGGRDHLPPALPPGDCGTGGTAPHLLSLRLITCKVGEEVPSDSRLDCLLQRLQRQPRKVAWKPGQGRTPGFSANGAIEKMQEGGRPADHGRTRRSMRRRKHECLPGSEQAVSAGISQAVNS